MKLKTYKVRLSQSSRRYLTRKVLANNPREAVLTAKTIVGKDPDDNLWTEEKKARIRTESVEEVHDG